MEIFLSDKILSVLANKQVFIDNDYLSLMFQNEEVFKKSLEIFSKSTLFIDPYTEFEFLRDIYVPADRIMREQFLSYGVFVPALKHQEIYSKIQENALLLSKLYAHQNSKTHPSSIDLLLAGRLMYHKSNICLISGNKKDFPSCIFRTSGVISLEKDLLSGMRAFSIIEFDEAKFNSTFAAYDELETRGAKLLAKELS